MYADAIVTPVMPRWLDAAIVDTTWAHNVAGFYAVNLIAAFAAVILLIVYLRCFLRSAALRLLLVTYWLIQWHTPVRYTFFNPVNIEPLFLALATAGLLAIERLRARRLEWQVFAITLLVFVGVFAREAMTLLAGTFIAAHWRAWPRGRDRLLVVVPLLGAGVAIAGTRIMNVPSEPYQPWSETLAVVRSRGRKR
jgi:hypothetical protein